MKQASEKRSRLVFFISLLAGLGGILYGYDIGVVSGALPFMQKTITMTDAQTGFVVGAVLGGGLIGTLVVGVIADKFGRRTAITWSSTIFLIGVITIIFSHTFVAVLLARLLLGIGVGFVAVAVPLYVAELVPASDRGRYVTFFQLFLTFGIVLAYFVDLAFTPSGNWRGMFAVVSIPAIVLLVGVLFLPETPRWLIVNGKLDKARAVAKRLVGAAGVDGFVQAIQDSLREVKGSWKEVFHSHLFKFLLIGIFVTVLNQWVGINVFLQYAPNILKQAGMGSSFASMMGAVGIGILNFIFTIVGVMLVDKVGRKKLLVTGVVGILIAEVFLAIISMLHLSPTVTAWLSLVGLFAFIIFFAVGPGVVVWLAVTELLPTRVRGTGTSICLFFSSLAGWLISSYFLVLRDWIGTAGTYWVCAFFALCYFLVAKFMLPETKDKTLEEIQHEIHQHEI